MILAVALVGAVEACKEQKRFPCCAALSCGGRATFRIGEFELLKPFRALS
jgi:hypothetical protein